MKWIGIVLIPSIILLAIPVLAHEPSEMNLSYDETSGELEVSITHLVSDANSHYIEKVEITVNGAPYDSHSYTSQPSNSDFTYTYQVNADAGDTISVLAVCNQVGNIQGEIEVGSIDPGDDDEGAYDGDDSPGLSLAYLLIALIMLSFLIRVKRK